MKVKVVKLRSNGVQEGMINLNMQDFLNLGEEYIVFAITIQKHTTYIQIYIDKKLISVPLELFEIIDSRVSKYWLVSYINSTTRFWPNEFYQEFFHDDLFEEVPEIVLKFNNVKNKIEKEFISSLIDGASNR